MGQSLWGVRAAAAAVLAGALLLAPTLRADKAAGKLPVRLPAGATLPVRITHGLDAKHAKVGEPVIAQLLQRVPLGEGQYLPDAAEIVGTVIASPAGRLTLQFTQLRLHHTSEPIHVMLTAAADRFDVEQTRVPLGGPTRSTSEWTTKQIGGDELYGVNVATKVYDRYSQPVGRADGTGVYAPPLAPGLPERALGPFSTTASGLYGMTGLSIVSRGGARSPIIFGLTDPKWQLRGGSCLLLQVVAP